MNVCSYSRLSSITTGAVNERFALLFKEVCYLRAVSSSAGSVSSVSVTSANGFAGSVASASTTPAITISTSITGILKGNGTAISAAVANTDYLTPSGSTTGSAATLTTPRAINGVNFDGSAPITITAAAGTLTGTTLNSSVVSSSLTSVGTLANLTVTNPISGSVTGNAATVTTNANLTGDVTSVGNATTLTNAPVIAKVLTGYAAGAGTVAGTDSILQAIQKLDGNQALKAPLASPVLTGTPTAPTAAISTNTTQVATTAYVDRETAVGWALTFTSTGFATPVVNTTYYFGASPHSGMTTSATQKYVEIPYNCKVIGYSFAGRSSVASNPATPITLSLVNVTTATTTQLNNTFVYTGAGANAVSASGLNIDLSAGDEIQFKLDVPNWSTQVATNMEPYLILYLKNR